MTAGIESAKRQLADILKRVERLENAQNWAKTPTKEGTLVYKTASDTMESFTFPRRNQSIEVKS